MPCGTKPVSKLVIGSANQAPPSEPIGTRDIDSTPPARTRSSQPERTFGGGHVDGFEARGTEAVLLDAGDGVGQPGGDGGDPGDVGALVADRADDAEHDVVDGGRVEAGEAARGSRGSGRRRGRWAWCRAGRRWPCRGRAGCGSRRTRTLRCSRLVPFGSGRSGRRVRGRVGGSGGPRVLSSGERCVGYVPVAGHARRCRRPGRAGPLRTEAGVAEKRGAGAGWVMPPWSVKVPRAARCGWCGASRSESTGATQASEPVEDRRSTPRGCGS